MVKEKTSVCKRIAYEAQTWLETCQIIGHSKN